MTSHAHDHRHGSIAELLDLDARVLRHSLLEIVGWMASHAERRPVRRILDIGAGTGTGTVALARRFTDAEVVAVDVSSDMLHRLRERATADRLAERVSAVQADLDAPWPELGSFDLVWASATLHEFADPDGAFGNIRRVLEPGGLLTIVEMDGPPRFLEDQVGDGLEARIHTILRDDAADRNDHPDWSDDLARAGFAPVEETTFAVELPIDGRGDGGRYAQAYLRRVREFVAPRLTAADRAVLDALVADDGPESLRSRDDLRVRTGRRVWAARRS